MQHKVGILTGGGDCPGLNAVIRAVVRKIENAGGTCVGLLEGWRGLVKAKTCELTAVKTDPIISFGGTILGSSRTNPYKNPDDVKACVDNFKALGLTALVAIGGDDTLGVASKLYDQFKLATVGVPKTIDNDLSATDFTFGFDTAINIVVECVERLRTTAESHRRMIVIETMGRHAGWIACLSGMAVGADYILVPEVTADFDHMCSVLKKRRDQGKLYALVVVSEGASLPDKGMVASDKKDAFGHVQLGGVGQHVAEVIESRLKVETRCVVLGHLQRGGAPSAADRVLGTRFGLKAAELVLEGRFGYMSSLRGQNTIGAVPLADAVSANRKLDMRYYEEAKEFFK